MNSPPTKGRLGTLRRRLLFLLLLPLMLLLAFSLAVDYRIAFEPAAEAYDHALADDAVALAGRVRFLDSRLQVDFPAAAEAVLRTDRSDQEYLSIYGPDRQFRTCNRTRRCMGAIRRYPMPSFAARKSARPVIASKPQPGR